MLEGLVAGLLNRFLGMYVKNFDPAQLKVGIWSGDVELRDLELRREALDQLKLPINVVEGHLGQLTLVIPWSNLRGAPVKIFIEDVFLLASPKEEAEYNEEEEERRKHRLKMEKLDSAELLKERSQEGLSQEEQKRSQSFTQSLVTKIVDNLQVTVKNIHVRYEDAISAPGHPFALGITLEEFSAVSTDGEWKPTFLQDSRDTTHKLATLGALAVYWNTDTKLLGPGREAQTPGTEMTPHDEVLQSFRSMIVRGDSEIAGDHQFILKPVSGQAKIELDKTGAPKVPKFKANLLFDEIGLVLDDHQYRDALMMVDLFHYFVRHQEYKKYQPKGVTPKEDPRAWLRFAGDAVLSKIHDRNRRWSWAYFKERRDDRIRYIELFKKKKQNQPLSPQENEELNKLEWKLDYEDLRFWRSLARNQLKKENAEALKNRPPAQPQQQQQGWLAWAWGSKPQPHQEKQDETENTEMTEEQRKELYEVIDWDEKTALAAEVDVPRDTVKMQLGASLSTGSFTLRQSPHGDCKDLVSLYFDVFKVKGLKRPDSFLADLSLGGLRVNDGTTPDSLFKEIVRVKDAPDAAKSKRMSIVELEKAGEEAFFHFQLEQNPLDGQGDIALTAKLRPLEIVWNPNVVIGVVDFFRPPERHMESVTALMETAGATVEGLREQTRAGLEFALEEHKTINAKLDLQAPLIIIPETITSKKSTCLIVDAGHISVNSELVDRDTMKEIQSKQSYAYTDEDLKQLESLMYDRFIVKLTSTQVLIGPSIEETKQQLVKKDDRLMMHIVEEINVDFVVETSILPKAPNLTKLKVSGHLPVLHASASDAKYKSLMRIIDVAIPKLGDDQPPSLQESRPVTRPRAVSNVSTRSRKKHDRRKSSSFLPFATHQQAIILNDDDLDDDDDQFVDAKDGSADEQLKMKQRSFEFKFTVDKLKGSLYRTDPDRKRPDQLLVELVAERFDLEFYLRQYDMVAEVSLGSVTVDDFVDNPPAEFKSIVSSGDSEDRQQERDLVHVKFVRVKKESPQFMPVYEGVETNVDVAVSTINLIVTRKTLLTLLDFILVTFTNSENTSNRPRQKAVADDESETDIEVVPPSPVERPNEGGATRVKVDLKSIRLILNNDGIRLATLSFNHADVGVFLLGKTMRVSTKLGDLNLVDDVNLGVSEESAIRQLVTIQGDELADFRYETFDAENPDLYPGYDSSVHLRAGSIKVNFLEEPFRKIVEFLVKFGKMQAIYNAARQAAANQANQLQQSQSQIRFDVVIKTPIVVFPAAVVPERPKRNLITAYLGEIYAQNKFAPLDDSETSEIAMKLTAGIRNIRLTSNFHYTGDRAEELELIDHVDLGFNITYAEHKDGVKRPDLEIEGSMTDFNLRITQYQLNSLLDISRSVPAAFAGDPDQNADEAAERDVDDATLARARTMSGFGGGNKDEQPIDMSPELGSTAEAWTKLDLVFNVSTIGLELINAPEDEPVGDLDAASLSKFSLDASRLKTRMDSNGSLEAEFVIRSFTIYDSRQHETTKFRRIMTSSNQEVQQFMASVSMAGGKDRAVIAMVAIDSPRVMFSLDYLFAIQHFVTAATEVREPPQSDKSPIESPEEMSDADSMQVSFAGRRSESTARDSLSKDRPEPKKEESTMSIAYRVNVVDAQVILTANPHSASSEAIVLGTKQILLSQQHALTFQVSECGMFLCRMDRFDDTRLRIIDDFSVQMSMDSSQPSRTNIHIDIEPLILRLSLRDILLIMQTISKASEMSGNDSEEPAAKASDQKAKQLKRPGAGRKTSSMAASKSRAAASKSVTALTTQTGRSQRGGPAQPHDVVKAPPRHEELTATIDGIRVVLIGDLHELPILDMSIKKFTAGAENWSTNLQAEAAIDMYTNIYNFAKSAWEPLIEPWQVGFGVAREQGSGLLSVDVASKRNFDVTITTATIALASKSFAFLTQDQDVLGKPRGAEAPYRIRNYTGFDVVVSAKRQSTEETTSLRLEDGQEVPWSFEDWEKMRENLLAESAGASNVAVQLEGSGFDSVKNIRLNREGEFLYALKPKADNVLHKLMVEVKLGTDNVKYVTLRSPLLVENETDIPVELGVYDAQEGHLLKIEKIAPGEARPAPVGAVYLKSLLVRPDPGFGYGWSNDTLWWRDLLKRPTRTMVCKGEHGDPFYFQLSASYDKANPVTKNYPCMRLKLSAPVTLENLLPYDFKYTIYDKNTKKDWSNFLRRGGVSPVHVVELSHLLLLSIDMQDTAFKPSEFAIINSGNSEDFRKETQLPCRDDAGLSLNLRLHYYRIPDSGGAFKVTVYSPYIILNKTGLDLSIRSKGFMQQSKAAAGQLLGDTSDGAGRKAQPLMFSFNSDDQRNRASLKVADSEWSKPQSFDAIGSTTEVVLNSTTRNAEIHLGITVDSGHGKYKMVKTVTLAPRYVIYNKVGDEINIREPSSSSVMTLKSGALQPLHFLQRGAVKQLCLCYPGVNNQWTAPFNISDLGITHVKVTRAGQRQQLIRVEILMEDATIFLHLSMETKNWPFSMRNESDTEFTFYQANPNLDEDGGEDRSGWRPIRYRLPPRSIMPYAWDFPAAKRKEVCISAYGKERYVKLAEIGNLMPMKLVGPDGQSKIIDLNVTADGPTQTLILSNFKPSKSLYRQRSNAGAQNRDVFEAKALDTGVTFRAQLKLAGVGISLINAQPKELAYITFRDVQLRYSDSPLYQTVSLAVKWIQIDNQLFGGIFPMILYPSVVPKRAQEIEAHPSLHAMVTRVKDDSYGVEYIKYATILLQQMTVELDEDFIYAVLDFSKVPGASWSSTDEEDKLCDENIDIPEPKQQQAGRDIYFEVLNIQPMQLDLSFVRTERVNVEDKTSSRNPIMFFFNVLTMAIGNINDAPVRFNALMLENVRVSIPVLMQNISNHYSQEALYQIHKILGSADFLGNPVGLFNNISSGFADIFYEPYQGLIMSDKPEDFGIGLARGAGSFFKKSVYGFTDSFSKVTGSFAKGLAAATMDKQFQDRRRITRARNRPKHALYGVTTGANSLFTSVASGVGGLARKPLEGAEQEGALGFLKGVGKGVIGLATKPAIGVLDFASNVSEGLRNTTTVFDGSELDRVRLPRYIPADGIVRPYNQREALGQSWLKQVDNGKYFDEQYIAHLELPTEDMVVMVTFARILLIRSRKLTSEWDVPLKEVQTIAKERTGLSLTLRGGSNGPFIPVGEESGRAFLYRMVAVAVEEFNRRFRGLE
ncbi:putative vacuolar protein sorting-associated protein [Diplogelasinospora grovesii]|uniref:Vacuolar protein sorting-associated protein n=1 Tax=Diplogelasinospora grovesii TaxID=303347 RepID=A0AAN6N364_9PEZI|nr:putative vacuolar protein sorting-associated protein [Diplogelasinospora grovesii]